MASKYVCHLITKLVKVNECMSLNYTHGEAVYTVEGTYGTKVVGHDNVHQVAGPPSQLQTRERKREM